MSIYKKVFSYDSAGVARLLENTLQRDFNMFKRAGLRGVIAYDNAVRDADNDVLPQVFSYFAQLPAASSKLSALSMATTGLLREAGPGVLLDLKGAQGEHAYRFGFTLDNRKIDLTLVNSSVPGAEIAARAAPLGLGGIAVNDRGFTFASDAYLRDQSLKCLTINDDLAARDRYKAVRLAEALARTPAYRNFKIVR